MTMTLPKVDPLKTINYRQDGGNNMNIIAAVAKFLKVNGTADTVWNFGDSRWEKSDIDGYVDHVTYTSAGRRVDFTIQLKEPVELSPEQRQNIIDNYLKKTKHIK